VSSIPEEALAAIEALVDQEFNAGVSSGEATVEVGEARKDTPDLTFDDQGRAHGPDGKFASVEGSAEEDIPTAVGTEQKVEDGQEQPGESEAGQEAASDAEGDGLEANADGEEEDQLVLELDEAVLELIDTKYGGDIEKALNSLLEAQSLIGKQGNELGELRELRQQFDQLQQSLFLQSQAQGVDWDEVIAEDPEQATRLAAQYQNPQAFEQALEAWAQLEPVKVFTFLQEAQNAEDAPEPTTLEAEIDALKAKHPDLQSRLPDIQKEAEQRPALARLLQDEDPRVRAEALEDLYHLAGSRTVASDTSKAAKAIILRAKAEADSAKSDASVVSASNTSAAVAAPTNPNEGLQQALRELSGLDDLVIV